MLTPSQPYVTELDLRHSLIPDEVIENLLESMPKHEGPDLLEDRELPKYDYITFMEKMMDSGNDEQAQSDKGHQKSSSINGGY
jgi:hypothetical protein